MYSLKNKKPKSKKVLAAIALLAIVLVGLSLSQLNNKQSSQEEPATVPTADTIEEGEINLSPVTEEEIKASDENKQQIVQREEAVKSGDNLSTAPTNNATIVLVEASKSSVKAYVSGIFEEGGTCKAVATKGDQSYTKSTTGFQNVSNTQCPPIRWTEPLSPGTWSLIVTYSSSTSNATLNKTINIE